MVAAARALGEQTVEAVPSLPPSKRRLPVAAQAALLTRPQSRPRPRPPLPYKPRLLQRRPHPNAPAVDLEALLLDVVSDKTGYPADMLDMAMALESDLAIDSIKRVEILSAVREAAPSLPEVDTAEMAKLVTLGQVVEHLRQALPASGTASTPQSAAPSVVLEGLLLSVVSDKTGYPADMLDMSMALESDLGIDSIKRVEILSAVREAAPGLPEVDTAEMAQASTPSARWSTTCGPTLQPAGAVPAAAPATSAALVGPGRPLGGPRAAAC